jgi:signal transduction histidine kinase
VYLLVLGLTGEILVYFGIAPNASVTIPVVFASAMALMAGLLSDGIRERVKRTITTHFYRSKYDYRREWMDFTDHVSRVERPDLIAERIIEKVTLTIAASSGALWLRGPARRWRLAASVGSPAGFEGVDPEVLIAATPKGQLVHLWAGPVATRSILLEAEGQIVGLMAIGSLRGGHLTFEDEELLATFARQAAIVLLNARLSEELARARELEAVHRVSTFVLHDLKNCVAMLSLVSQNAQKHWRSPEFQREAFGTIGESVRQMQELMGRLANPRGQLEVAARQTPMNKLVEEMVARARAQPGGTIDIRTDLDSAVDTVAVTAEAIETIVSNLLLNAVEAIGDKGKIEVKTSREGLWVTLTVADTGCGMSGAFVEDELFVPLRTTKATGLGVGLYQVKSLVDSVGGRIRVESRPGQGTTFWVDLPAERVLR